MAGKRSVRAPGFTVRRDGRRTLVEQIVDGFTGEIFSGAYLVGDRVPSVRQLADDLGVSVRVTRAAMTTLLHNGFVRVVAGRGTFVSRPGADVIRGNVLVITPDVSSGYFMHRLVASFRETLQNAAYQVYALGLRAKIDGNIDFARLDAVMARKCDLVFVADGTDDEIVEYVRERGIPCLSFRFVRRSARKGCAGLVSVSWERAMADLAKDLRKRKFRHVVQVDFHPPAMDLRSLLRGVRLETKVVRPKDGVATLANIRQAAADWSRTCYGTDRRRLPDVFFFSDDYVATGALVGLAESGLLAGRDFAFVSLVNAQLGQPFSGALGEVVSDPVAYGQRVAAAALEMMEGTAKDVEIVLEPRYRPATFEGVEPDETHCFDKPKKGMT